MSNRARRDRQKRSAKGTGGRPQAAADHPPEAGGPPTLSAQAAQSLATALQADAARRKAQPAMSPARTTTKDDPTATRPVVDVTAWSCASVDGVDPQALGMTYWLPPSRAPRPASLTVRFTGSRVGAPAVPAENDRFVTEVKVGPLPSSTRPVAVTGRAVGIAAGEWQVSATHVQDGEMAPVASAAGRGRGRTAFAPVVRVQAPGVRLYAWPGLVLLGTTLALLMQYTLARAQGLPSARLLAVTGVACVVGTVGAKAYYVLTHRHARRGVRRPGMSVQGFVLAAFGTLALGALLAGVPVGAALDVTTPGLLLGMTIGRFGCFFGGCCAGRPTTSSWGLWSSDRVLGMRRVPVQLIESGMAAALAVGSAALLLAGKGIGGAVFVAGIGAYTFGRQLLFPLRHIPRTTAYGRPLVMALSSFAVVAALTVRMNP